ncbi:MAG: hypothetical protein ABW032_01225 [Burkholderiaceae bacterium]
MNEDDAAKTTPARMASGMSDDDADPGSGTEAAATDAARGLPPPTALLPRDELIAGLGRGFRGAIFRLDVELHTTIARQIFRRDFVYVSQQLHALEASRRVQGLDRGLLDRALAAVATQAGAAKALLRQTASETDSLVAFRGHPGVRVEFARPTRFRATIVSPYAGSFLELLQIADETLAQLERAWLLGALAPDAKARRANACRRSLQDFKELVRQQRHLIGRHVREVNAVRNVNRRTLPEFDPDSGGGASASVGAGPKSRPGTDAGAPGTQPPDDAEQPPVKD